MNYRKEPLEKTKFIQLIYEQFFGLYTHRKVEQKQIGLGDNITKENIKRRKRGL